MRIADSHEFIELYRGDKDLRMGIELVDLRPDVRFFSLAPDSVSPAERAIVGSRKLPASALPAMPDRMELRLLPSVALRFAHKEVGGVVAYMPGYARELASIRPDVIMEDVYTWLTPRSYATDRVARRLGVPLVFYDPGDDIPVNRQQRLMLPFERPVLDRVSAVITYNEVGRRRFVDKYGYPDERIRVIPKPVDVARCRQPEKAAEARRALGIPPDRFVVGHLGRLTRFRGSVVLAEAARRALDDPRFDGVTFLFIGGTLNSDASADTFCLSNTVVTGMVPNHEVPALLAAADVVVFPDLASHPGFTTAIAEAMAAARPLIVGFDPDHGAVPLTPGVTCLTVPPASPEAIAEAVLLLRDDPAQARTLGDAVGRFASERMDYPRVASAYLDLFDELTGGTDGAT
jgi:glycosyltransferase involved in cell wall biosynthesis